MTKRKNLSTGAGTEGGAKKSRGRERKKSGARGQSSDAPKRGLSGVPGSKNDSRRCTAKAHRTGERCKAPAIKGGNVCRVHGGATPAVKKSAKERLLELVDPALATLHKVLTNPDADDAHKVRAALGILDRTGFRPGMDVSVHGPTPWEQLADEAFVDVDRALPDPGDEPVALGEGRHSWEDVEVFSKEAQREAWREYDAEDEQPWASRMDRYGPGVVQGEVVNGSVIPDPEPPNPNDPTDPPRYAR